MVNGPNTAHSSIVTHSHFTTRRKRNPTHSKALASRNICLTYESSFKDPHYLGKYVYDEKCLPLDLMANLCQMFNGSKNS